jgi:hypothetical protein
MFIGSPTWYRPAPHHTAHPRSRLPQAARRPQAACALRCQQPVLEFIALLVPDEPIDVLEPGVVEPDIPPALPSVVPELPEPVEPLEPRLLVEPLRSSAPLPVEPDEPIAVPLPLPVPLEALVPELPAAPSADVDPGVPDADERVHGMVEPELLFEPGLAVEPELPVTPGFAVDPDEVWPSARPPAVANADAVTSIANVFLLAFMFKLLGAVERMVRFPGNPWARAHGLGGVRQFTPLVSH